MKSISVAVISIILVALTPLSVRAASFVASVDTMKESMDTETRPLTDAQIANDVNLAASLNVTHITVDTHWDYPAYAQKWINAIRAAGKHVWFRMHPNQWENNNGTTGIMTPSQYLAAETAYITGHPTFFQSGDILDMNPEPENGLYWKATYGNSWTSGAPNTATDDFNSFYINVTETANTALAQIGVSSVITNIRSTNSWFAMNPSSLYQSTVNHMGVVTIDSYPDQDTTDPTTAATNRINELTQIENIRGVPIIIAEIGYSNHINVDDATQNNVLTAELNAIEPLNYIAGMNYWVGAGTSNSGGYTHIFAGSNGNWTLRPAAITLSNFYAKKLASPTSTPVPTAVCNLPNVVGDTNADGKIDGIDFVTVLIHFNQTILGPTSGDVNCSGKVDASDLNTVISNIHF